MVIKTFSSPTATVMHDQTALLTKQTKSSKAPHALVFVSHLQPTSLHLPIPSKATTTMGKLLASFSATSRTRTTRSFSSTTIGTAMVLPEPTSITR